MSKHRAISNFVWSVISTYMNYVETSGFWKIGSIWNFARAIVRIRDSQSSYIIMHYWLDFGFKIRFSFKRTNLSGVKPGKFAIRFPTIPSPKKKDYDFGNMIKRFSQIPPYYLKFVHNSTKFPLFSYIFHPFSNIPPPLNTRIQGNVSPSPEIPPSSLVNSV